MVRGFGVGVHGFMAGRGGFSAFDVSSGVLGSGVTGLVNMYTMIMTKA